MEVIPKGYGSSQGKGLVRLIGSFHHDCFFSIDMTCKMNTILNRMKSYATGLNFFCLMTRTCFGISVSLKYGWIGIIATTELTTTKFHLVGVIFTDRFLPGYGCIEINFALKVRCLTQVYYLCRFGALTMTMAMSLPVVAARCNVAVVRNWIHVWEGFFLREFILLKSLRKTTIKTTVHTEKISYFSPLYYLRKHISLDMTRPYMIAYWNVLQIKGELQVNTTWHKS